MVYALCFDTNTLIAFRSEREATEYCRANEGDWQLCDEHGQAMYPIGFTPSARVGLLAAHMWVTNAHDDGSLAHTTYSMMGLLGHGHSTA